MQFGFQQQGVVVGQGSLLDVGQDVGAGVGVVLGVCQFLDRLSALQTISHQIIVFHLRAFEKI